MQLNELFDQPYKWQWGDPPTDNAESVSAIFDTEGGSEVVVYFDWVNHGTKRRTLWEVVFQRDDEEKVTGQ